MRKDNIELLLDMHEYWAKKIGQDELEGLDTTNNQKILDKIVKIIISEVCDGDIQNREE